MQRACLFSFSLLLLVVFSFFKKEDWKVVTANPAYIHRTMKEVTDVIVHDIYSPPVASRIYAYVSVAGYEAAIANNENYFSLAAQLHGLNTLPKPAASIEYSGELAAVHAMLLVTKTLVISEDRVENFHKTIMEEYKNSGMPQDVYENSLFYGKQVADQVLAWAAKDNYKETRSLAKYAVVEEDGSWKPTPPAYMKAVESHWGKMRTFIIDSAQEFKPLPALTFSPDSSSAFYKEAKAVHDIGVQLTDEQKDIASFWDCNPFKMNVNGHVMYATKKFHQAGIG